MTEQKDRGGGTRPEVLGEQGVPVAETGNVASRVVSSMELLELRQDSWGRRLKGVSLVAEELTQVQHAEQVLRVLGTRYRIAGVHDRTRVLRRWPAVQVMATVSVAAEHFSQGAFWPALTSLAGCDGQVFPREWGDAFLDNLGELALPDFGDIEDPGLKYLGPILMHSGVPTYCLGDYYRLILDRRRSDAGITPEEFVAWAAARALEGRLYNIDKPVERFLRYGGDYAVDVTDRVFDLLDEVAMGRSGDDVALPDRFRHAALHLRDANELGRVPSRRQASDLESSRAPRIMLDPYGRGPMLRLPAVDTSSGGRATWSITTGTKSNLVQVQSLWPGEPAPSTDVPIASPIRSATVALVGYDRLSTQVGVVDDKDPLLAFSEDGERQPFGLPLRGPTVWLLFPGSADELAVDGSVRLLAEGALPPGWAGWSLVLLDISRARSVQGPRSDRTHRVRGMTAARIVTADPVEGVRTRSGAPIFSEPPGVVLPGNNSADSHWTITISDDRGVALVEGLELASTDDPRAAWDRLPRPLLGSYSVRVRGPWGRGAVREVAIAEGLRATAAPTWRRGTSRGLVVGTVQLAGAPGTNFEPSVVELGEGEVESRVIARTSTRDLSVVVRPPHLSISYLSDEFSVPPTIRPLRLSTEGVLASAGHITLEVKEGAQPLLHVLVGSQPPLQVIQPGKSTNGALVRFDLNQVADTLAVHQRVRLALDPGGELAIASISPKRLFSSVRLDGAQLVFGDMPRIDGLVAVVFQARAPWSGGTLLPVIDGVVALPPGLTESGPLVVHVRVDDPWVPVPIPKWPPADAAFIDAPGYAKTGTEPDQRLSAYLSGEGPFPAGDVEPARIWPVAARLPLLGLGVRARDVARDCARELCENPVASLLALDASRIEADRLPQLLIRYGLLTRWAPAPPLAHVPWSRAGAIASAILTSRRVLEARDTNSPDIVDARLICGDVLDQLLLGEDPCQRAGRIDASADQYARLDDETQSEFKRMTGLVPQGLLDQDSRTMAAFELLDNRGRARTQLIDAAGQSLERLLALLRATDDTAGLTAVNARRHPTIDHDWRALSALSIGWAWTARRAARGGARQRAWIESQAGLWRELARIAPHLVTIDVVLAEFLLASRQHERSPE